MVETEIIGGRSFKFSWKLIFKYKGNQSIGTSRLQDFVSRNIMKHASSTRYRKLTLFFLFQCLLLKITVVQINDGLSWSNLLKKYQEVLNLGGLYRKWQLIEIYSVNKCKNRISRCVLCFSCRFFFRCFWDASKRAQLSRSKSSSVM